MIRALLYFCLLCAFHVESFTPPIHKANPLYSSLDPTSIPEHLAFYRLYPNTQPGKQALTTAFHLLNSSNKQIGNPNILNYALPLIEELIEVVNRPPSDQPIEISEPELTLIDQLASHLKNRQLKGHWVQRESEVLELAPEEIDLSRALLISQLEEKNEPKLIRSYEAVFDLMTLQILARLPKGATDKQKIEAINYFVFDEMHFRFPPHSASTESIDLYSFLPSVIDSRRGVCLGVSILYLCIAQRMGLSLEIITPPGHIFVRYETDEEIINIETTCRGIHMPDDKYLNLETKALQHRNIKEVIGMAHFNHAAVFWQKEHYEPAIKAYEKARDYMVDDPLVKELLGYNYLFVGDIEKGTALLKEVVVTEDQYQIGTHSVPEDFLAGKVDPNGIKNIYGHIDEKRESLEEKRDKIKENLGINPLFRAGWLHLAITHLQLHQVKEGLQALETHHTLDQSDPTAEYYLAALYFERLNLPKAWEHYRIANRIASEKGHYPDALKELKRTLLSHLIE